MVYILKVLGDFLEFAARAYGRHLGRKNALLLLTITLSSMFVVEAGVHAQTCFPSLGDISNDFPQYAGPDQRITITTHVTVNCMLPGYAVTVDIIPTGTANILSYAAGAVAANQVTTPSTIGPWSLSVYVQLVQLSMARTTAYSNNTIVIQIVSGTTTQALLTAENVSTTLTVMLTSTVTGEPNVTTQFVTQTESVLVVQEEQGYGLLAAIFAAGFIIVTLILARSRKRGRGP